MEAVKELNVPRCYKPSKLGKTVNSSLHHFSDAIKNGYGQGSYLQTINEDGEIYFCLVFRKSRVAPVKHVSIPRLELTAANLSVKILKLLREELDPEMNAEFFRTVNQVV